MPPVARTSCLLTIASIYIGCERKAADNINDLGSLENIVYRVRDGRDTKED